MESLIPQGPNVGTPFVPPTAQPTQPVQAAAAPTAAPGAGNLVQSWTEYLQSPQIRSAMMQFGVSMLQPRAAGQTMLGQIGQSFADAGGAAQRVSEFQRLDRKDQREQKRLDQATEADTARLGLDQQRVDIAKRSEDREVARDAAAAKQQEIENDLAKEKLKLQAQSQAALNGYYQGIIGSKKTVNPPGYDDALDVIKSAAALEDDPIAYFIQEKAKVDAQFGVGGTAPQAAAGPSSGTPMPQDKAAEILKAQPTPENRKYFDEVYGAGAAAKVLGK